MLISVVAPGDALRHERQTRSLHAALSALDGVDVDYLVPEPVRGDGHKGAAEQLALVAAIGVASRPAVQLLVTAIKEWCAASANRKVLVKDGDTSMELTGRISETEARLVKDFLDSRKS